MWGIGWSRGAGRLHVVGWGVGYDVWVGGWGVVGGCRWLLRGRGGGYGGGCRLERSGVWGWWGELETGAMGAHHLITVSNSPHIFYCILF